MAPALQTAFVTSTRVGLRTLAVPAPRLAGRLAYRLFSTPRRRAPVPSTVESVMARAERRDLRVDDGRVVAYRWRADAAGDRPRVVLAHGWESRAARLAVWVDPLLAAGFEVVAYDAPAHGLSDGRRSDPLRFADSVRAAADAFGPFTAGVGHSLGGVALALAVAGGGLLDRRDLPIERLAIVGGADSGVDAMSMFCDVLGLGEAFLPIVLDGAAEAAGRPVTSFDVHRLLDGRPIPILWQHDRDDDAVPLVAAQRVEAACPHVELVTTTGLGHHTIARDPEVIRRAVDFLTVGSAG